MKPTDFAHHLTEVFDGLSPGRNAMSARIPSRPIAMPSYSSCGFAGTITGSTPSDSSWPRLTRTSSWPFWIISATDRQVRYWDTQPSARRPSRLFPISPNGRTRPDLLQCQRILAIPSQRSMKTTEVNYLSVPRKSRPSCISLTSPHAHGRRRDAVLLSLLYDTGARVQELIDLSVQDVRLDAPAQVRLTGKGRKQRLVPLMANTVAIVRDYVMERGLDRADRSSAPLFFNRHGGRLSRSGIRYILAKYVAKARGTQPVTVQRVSPHTLRHTKAMNLLQAGTPLVIIRDILGHADLKSTEIYAKADLEMKRQALANASCQSPDLQIPSWQQNETLMEWLRSL